LESEANPSHSRTKICICQVITDKLLSSMRNTLLLKLSLQRTVSSNEESKDDMS